MDANDRGVTMRGLSWLLVLALGCGDDGSAATSGGTTASDATDSLGSTQGEASTAGSTAEVGTVDPPTSGSPTGESVGETTPTGTEASATEGEESSTGLPPIQLCGLEDLKAGAPNPVVSGTEPMQLPPDIAIVLVENCGCHYADMLDVGPPVADYSSLLPLHIETWEQFHSDYGAPPKSTIAVVLERVRDSPLQTTMPHRSCHVGDGLLMWPDERELLIAWLDAGAPDGATWVP